MTLDKNKTISVTYLLTYEDPEIETEEEEEALITMVLTGPSSDLDEFVYHINKHTFYEIRVNPPK